MTTGPTRSDFWSRRRAAVAAEDAALDAALETETDVELEARPDAEILAERGLPDPDTLDTPEDIRAFLAEALPQRLKTRALRRLWRLNPVLANLDGLLDYGEDFTDSAMVIENMQTAYQVGKGMLKHIEALAEAEAAKSEKDLEHVAPEPDEVLASETDAATEHDEEIERAASDVAAPPASVAPDARAEVAPVSPSSRRMIFTFEEQRT